MSSGSTLWRLIPMCLVLLFSLGLASEAQSGVFVSKTKTSYLRITLNENRQPVRLEGIVGFDCQGPGSGTSRIDLQGREIRRYKDGSFGFRRVTSGDVETRRKLRARLTGGRVKGFYSFRSQDDIRCWSGKSYRKSGVAFEAGRRDLGATTYVWRDSGAFLNLTLTRDGNPIRVKGSYPLTCDGGTGLFKRNTIDAYVPEDFRYFGDGSFGIGAPLRENYNSLIQGLRARLSDGIVDGSFWWRFRLELAPGEEQSCYSGASDADPTVTFQALER